LASRGGTAEAVPYPKPIVETSSSEKMFHLTIRGDCPMKPIRAPSKAIHRLDAHFVSSFFLIALTFCLIPAMLDAQTGQPSNVSAASVLYQFTGGIDGGSPNAGVVFDDAGNLYGTTKSGGLYGHGTVFELSPSESGWNETVLYSFTGGEDGDSPLGGVVLDGNGNLYGTTYQGGDPGCHCGTVFELIPTGGSWTFSLLHAFTGGSDGANPAAGLVWSPSGLFGTTENGAVSNRFCGGPGCGTIFWLFPYSVYTPFTNATGYFPHSGLFYDESQDCYWGTTPWGPGSTGWGTVFAACDRAIYTVHTFSRTGFAGTIPMAGVIMDNAGHVYGTTSEGDGFGGAVFKFAYTQSGSTLKVLHQFPYFGDDGSNPVGDLIFDADGNIYGTTHRGGLNNQGVVFKLTPQLKQKWGETVLYRFTGSDGANPVGGLVFDGADNLYGTTSTGGAYGAGVVFRVANQRVGPQATLPTGMSFGKQIIYTSSTPKTVTLSNTGDTLLAISDISLTPSGSFAISSNTCGAKLAPGTQCKVSVTFTPNNLGNFSGTLTFTDNAPGSPQVVALTGSGVLPASLTPAGANYWGQLVGTTSLVKTFTLSNNQAVTLDSIAISTTGDFAVSSTFCETSLAAKSTCRIHVTFTPTEKGTRTGTLSVSDSADNSPQTSRLTGTGK
jgi:uncharacterized repeat protein (TIGR03803 family)